MPCPKGLQEGIAKKLLNEVRDKYLSQSGPRRGSWRRARDLREVVNRELAAVARTVEPLRVEVRRARAETSGPVLRGLRRRARSVGCSVAGKALCAVAALGGGRWEVVVGNSSVSSMPGIGPDWEVGSGS